MVDGGCSGTPVKVPFRINTFCHLIGCITPMMRKNHLNTRNLTFITLCNCWWGVLYGNESCHSYYIQNMKVWSTTLCGLRSKVNCIGCFILLQLWKLRCWQKDSFLVQPITEMALANENDGKASANQSAWFCCFESLLI